MSKLLTRAENSMLQADGIPVDAVYVPTLFIVVCYCLVDLFCVIVQYV